MVDDNRLEFLKIDLMISSARMDMYLKELLNGAKTMIETEGIVLAMDSADMQLQVMYAAYLYRKRKGDDTGMPRMLRYALNNRLMQQKGRVTHGL